MAENSNIQWTDHTWNIARGCSKVDEDCKNCYMYRDSFDGTRYDAKQVIRTKTVFDLPLKLKKKNIKSTVWDGPPLIFTSSLTDVFHKDIDPYRNEMWDIIRQCPEFIFQILTKRPERILDHLPADWGNGWKNVWLGTSAGSMGDKATQRIKDLFFVRHSVGVEKLFLSLEPLWNEIDITNKGMNDAYNFPTSSEDYGGYKTEWADPGDGFIPFDWVIVGGESGNSVGAYKYRPCEFEWIWKIIHACNKANVPVFVKQLGTHLAKANNLHDRHGGDWNEWPKDLRVRQMPKI